MLNRTNGTIYNRLSRQTIDRTVQGAEGGSGTKHCRLVFSFFFALVPHRCLLCDRSVRTSALNRGEAFRPRLLCLASRRVLKHSSGQLGDANIFGMTEAQARMTKRGIAQRCSSARSCAKEHLAEASSLGSCRLGPEALFSFWLVPTLEKDDGRTLCASRVWRRATSPPAAGNRCLASYVLFKTHEACAQTQEEHGDKQRESSRASTGPRQ